MSEKPTNDLSSNWLERLWSSTVTRGEYDRVILPYLFANADQAYFTGRLDIPKGLAMFTRRMIAAASGMALGINEGLNYLAGSGLNFSSEFIFKAIGPSLVMASILVLGFNVVIDRVMISVTKSLNR